MALPKPNLPGGDGQIHVTTSRGETFLLPNTFNLSGLSFGREVSMAEPSLRNGAIRTKPPRWTPASLNLSGYLINDALPFSVYRFSDYVYDSPWEIRPQSQLGRYIVAEVESFTPTRVGDATTVAIDIELTALDPFFYASYLIQNTQQYDSVAGTGALDGVTNAGSVPARPLITITGGSRGVTNPSITNDVTGQVVQYFGSIGLNQELVIDASKLTATLDGANTLNSMNGSFFYAPMEFLHGPNSLTYGGTGIMTVEVTFREAWLID